MPSQRGTPFTGNVSLTPTNLAQQFPLYVLGGQAAYTLAPGERCIIESIAMSCNDSTGRLVTVDTKGVLPTKLASVYLQSTYQPITENIPTGICKGRLGVVPRAYVPALTTGKTAEIVIAGQIVRDTPVDVFFPDNMPGLFFDFDSRFGLGFGTGVSSWLDQSGGSYPYNGNAVLQLLQGTTSQQPGYTASDPNFNGLPSLQFSAAAQSQLINAVADISLPQPLLLVAVGMATNGTLGNVIQGAPGIVELQACNTSVLVYAGSALSATTALAGFPSVMMGVINGASSAVYVNNSQASLASGAAGANTLSSAQFAIGNNVSGTLGFTGSLTRLLAFNLSAAPTAAQLKNIATYLGNLYGITTS